MRDTSRSSLVVLAWAELAVAPLDGLFLGDGFISDV